MRRLIVAFLATLATGLIFASLAHPLRLKVDLASGRICSAYIFDRCGSASNIEVEARAVGILFDDTITIAVTSRTSQFGEHLQALVKDNPPNFSLGPIDITVRLRSAPEIFAEGDNFSVKATIDPSGLGVRARRTSVRGIIRDVTETLTIDYIDYSPAPDGVCGSNASPYRNYPNKTFNRLLK